MRLLATVARRVRAANAGARLAAVLRDKASAADGEVVVAAQLPSSSMLPAAGTAANTRRLRKV